MDGEKKNPKTLYSILPVILPFLVLAAGVGIAWYFVFTSPGQERRPRGEAVEAVRIITAEPEDTRVIVSAMGTVMPAREVVLKPRVSGEVIEVAGEFMPGGRFREGEVMLKIDPSDYELAVEQRKGDVARAECQLRLEEGRRDIAKREYEMLGEAVRAGDRDLVLRDPQLARDRAAVEAAKAALKKAELDHKRTTIRAPFNLVIRSRSMEVGSQANPATPIASVSGTDEYWVMVSVPLDRLKWLEIPGPEGGKGSVVRISSPSSWGRDRYREGRIIRLAAEIEKQGRMARVIVSVKDPLCIEKKNSGLPSMIIGMYVRAEIEGRKIRGAFPVPAPALREGSRLWIMGSGGRLEIRDVDVAWRDREQVLVSGGLSAGERIVTSDMAAPVAGMRLEVREAANRPASGPGGGS